MKQVCPEFQDFIRSNERCVMRMVRYYSLFLMCLVGSALHPGNSPIYAQDTSNNSKAKVYWANAGLGGSSFGFSGGASLSFLLGRSPVSIRYVNNGTGDLGPQQTVWDIGALYGEKNAIASWGFASISGGIGIVGGVYRRCSGKCEWREFLTVGIPVEGQIFWNPFSFLGIGIYGFGDLNLEHPFAGALLCVQVGKLR
jgi:hypothetical protein